MLLIRSAAPCTNSRDGKDFVCLPRIRSGVPYGLRLFPSSSSWILTLPNRSPLRPRPAHRKHLPGAAGVLPQSKPLPLWRSCPVVPTGRTTLTNTGSVLQHHRLCFRSHPVQNIHPLSVHPRLSVHEDAQGSLRHAHCHSSQWGLARPLSDLHLRANAGLLGPDAERLLPATGADVVLQCGCQHYNRLRSVCHATGHPQNPEAAEQAQIWPLHRICARFLVRPVPMARG